MSWADYCILALVAGYCLYLIFRKKKNRCSGDCASCRNSCEEKKEG